MTLLVGIGKWLGGGECGLGDKNAKFFFRQVEPEVTSEVMWKCPSMQGIKFRMVNTVSLSKVQNNATNCSLREQGGSRRKCTF